VSNLDSNLENVNWRRNDLFTFKQLRDLSPAKY
jgi:hypothetical protein